ncbi:MAG: hypothetical protein V9G20_30250 [Candidatus Promineifilaceae bacterium]
MVSPSFVLDPQQPEAVDLLGRPLDAERIGDHLTQHLVAAADAEDRPAAPVVRHDVDAPALMLQLREVGDGRLCCRG